MSAMSASPPVGPPLMPLSLIAEHKVSTGAVGKLPPAPTTKQPPTANGMEAALPLVQPELPPQQLHNSTAGDGIASLPPVPQQHPTELGKVAETVSSSSGEDMSGGGMKTVGGEAAPGSGLVEGASEGGEGAVAVAPPTPTPSVSSLIPQNPIPPPNVGSTPPVSSNATPSSLGSTIPSSLPLPLPPPAIPSPTSQLTSKVPGISVSSHPTPSQPSASVVPSHHPTQPNCPIQTTSSSDIKVATLPPQSRPSKRKVTKKSGIEDGEGIKNRSATEEGEEEEGGGGEESGDGRKSKRMRLPTQPYQSPIPELNLIAKLDKPANRPPDDKLIVFYRNEFLAVRNDEGGFYICQAMQNIYRSRSKLRIRWLSQNDGDLYTPDFYDTIDFDCILTNLNLERVEKNKFRLPPEESQRTESILKRAIDVEKGVADKTAPTEEHPDGLDLSLYRNEEQLKKRKRKSGVKSPKKKKGSSVGGERKSNSRRDKKRKSSGVGNSGGGGSQEDGGGSGGGGKGGSVSSSRRGGDGKKKSVVRPTTALEGGGKRKPPTIQTTTASPEKRPRRAPSSNNESNSKTKSAAGVAGKPPRRSTRK